MSRLLPFVAAFVVLAGLGLVAWAAASGEIQRGLRLDASTQSLVLEDDPEARRYDRTRLLFESDEFVLVGVRRDDLFTSEGIAAVASLHEAFAALEGVEDVQSLANVPLLRSFAEPVAPFMALARQERLVRPAEGGGLEVNPAVSLEKARAELTAHELFAGNLVSRDGATAGIVVTLVARPEHQEAAREWLQRVDARARAEERLARAEGEAARAAAREELARAEAAVADWRPRYRAAEDARKAERIAVVERIQGVVAAARERGQEVDLSGVPAIVVEMVDAIERDLHRFVGLSAAFLLLFLLAVFRRLRWTVLPLAISGTTVVGTLALMVALGKRITVITANVPSLLLVIGLAHSIHLIVRYRELLARAPGEPERERTGRLVRGLVQPCLFTATTTGVGFLSLYYAGSRPIIDFGLLMAAGVGLAFAVSFLVLPGALLGLPRSDSGRLERSARFLRRLGRRALRRPGLVLGLAALLFAAGGAGIARLQVEARFIDYFQPESPIHEGLTFIDRNLGGTSGLEVIVRGDGPAFGPAHPEHLDAAARVVEWLDEREEVGAVMSWPGFVDELRKLLPQAGRGAAAFQIGRAMSPRLRELLAPYVVLEEQEVGGRRVGPYGAVRIVARVHETDPELVRAELLRDVRAFLAREFPDGDVEAALAPPNGEGGSEAGGAPEEEPGGLSAHVTGMFVLYANMLQSLAGSQVKTSLVALGAILVMLAVLFRSLGAGLLALIPNLLPIVLVLGAMGWAGIPLDMATVMIASVSLGIGVDCAIHYQFRFREERRRGAGLAASLLRSHGSIGTSILYTSLTSVVGFSVLWFSAFRPNAYFGVLTGLAMTAALFGMLTLLPVLLTIYDPFRRRG